MIRISHVLLILLCGVLLSANMQSASAETQYRAGTPSDCTDGNCCTTSSSPCKVTCKLCKERVQESKYCWKVECDHVCIPPVKFPWTKCCELRCPKIRKIHVLKKHDYKINVCKYHWKLKKFWPRIHDKCIAE
ncbi:MAG: hypothetical protein JKY95_14190 [Planctomycetaceae bacterium]|nr:hypothetical protein [Planctomycetaceae bacterium]